MKSRKQIYKAITLLHVLIFFIPVLCGAQLPPANDNFANALSLQAEQISSANRYASKETGEPNHGYNGGGKSLWWKWIPPDSGYFSFDTYGSGFDTLLAVYTGSALVSLKKITQNNDDGHNKDSSLTFHADSGTLYYIAIDGYYGASGDFILNWRPAVRPSNDDFQNVFELNGISGQKNHSNRDATKETDEANHAGIVGGRSLWYSWTAPRNDYFFFNTHGSSFDTILAVYTDSQVGDLLTTVIGNADDGGTGKTSGVTFRAVSGTRYYIAVDGYYGACGDVVLNWKIADRPSNDDFASATELTGASGQSIASNAESTREIGEPAHAGNAGAGSVWWEYVPSETVTCAINTRGSTFNTLLAVYTGSDTGSLTEIRSSDNDGSMPGISGLSFQAVSGSRYYIAVDGYDGDSGKIVLNRMVFSPHAEIYKFERMWPALQQPWYFNVPGDIAIDKNDFVYIADTWNNRVQKFTTMGHFISKWGRNIFSDGNFGYGGPAALTADKDGFVYVNDPISYRIQKFSSDGRFLCKWGKQGTADGEFSSPVAGGLAVDKNGFIYVADRNSHQIQKFTDSGVFVGKWGRKGSANGEFESPTDIVFDSSNIAHVVDSENRRIQKFTSDGEFVAAYGQGTFGTGGPFPYSIAADSKDFIYVIGSQDSRIQKFTSDGEWVTQWGSYGSGDGQFGCYTPYPYGIAVDSKDYIYVADAGNSNVQKFTSDGQFLAKWTGFGTGNESFSSYGPNGIAMDAQGFLYVVDGGRSCIRKFTAQGQALEKWGSYGIDSGEFRDPQGIAADSEGFLYVLDRENYRVQKFGSDGKFVTKWGKYGTGDGDFNIPADTAYPGIAVDNKGFVYVSDRENYRVQKFTSDGQFVSKIECYDPDEGITYRPYGIAVDADGFLYVGDRINHRIHKFSPEGQLLLKWGTEGKGNGEFDIIEQLAADKEGFVYVSDRFGYNIQKFTSDGQFVAKFGQQGSDPGMVNAPTFLFASPSGDRVYVSDYANHRIQVFKRGLSSDKKMKAIIVAGGGPYPGNSLWDATQMSANFAYRAMVYQGFTKETIYYLSSNRNLDLDGNGVLDDVDADAVNSNLQEAVTGWSKDSDTLVIYLTDHGGKDVFRMSGTEIFSASDMNNWLNVLQASYSGKVIIVYDACESGSFISSLSGRNRIVIASTSPLEPAYFVNQGAVSFSSYFWSYIFNGNDVRDSFDFASDAMGTAREFQHPLIEASGNGIGSEPADLESVRNVFIGNGTPIYTESPKLDSLSESQTINGTSTARLYASGTKDGNTVAGVTVVVCAPGFTQESLSGPVQGFPLVDLLPVENNPGVYENIYSGFNIEGTYQLIFYPRDPAGKPLLPELATVTAINPLRRKVIMLAGISQSDPLWSSVERNIAYAYNALTFQRYPNDDIYLLSPAVVSDVALNPVLPTLSNLRYAVEIYAAHQTWDVVVYLIGKGGKEGFYINDSEMLSPLELDTWLDNLQKSIGGKVTVICDASCSENFISSLTPPDAKERILISSTGKDQPAGFVAGGTLSFSRFFWKGVIAGSTVRDAFASAQRSVRYLAPFSGMEQIPTMSDDGNSITNEKSDGRLASRYVIGAGIVLAGDDPLIGSVSAPQILSGTVSASVWAENVIATSEIESVAAIIVPPGSSPSSDSLTELPMVMLSNTGNGRYEGTYSQFNRFGIYRIVIYATDKKGNISLPAETQVEQTEKFQISLTLEGSANLLVFDSEKRECSKDGCGIPDASFESGSGGEQTVLLTPSESYRVVLQGTENDSLNLTIAEHIGDNTVSSVIKSVEIAAHQTLKAEFSGNPNPSSDMIFRASPSYDLNGDGTVDCNDIEMIVAKWHSEKDDSEYDRFYDIDDDGYISVADIMRVSSASGLSADECLK
jgi:sugar lactone lactonase YvrE